VFRRSVFVRKDKKNVDTIEVILFKYDLKEILEQTQCLFIEDRQELQFMACPSEIMRRPFALLPFFVDLALYHHVGLHLSRSSNSI
jgi:hypothetical protein